MIKNSTKGIDPALKEAMKNKIRAQIEKMKVAEAKGDNQAMQKIMILNQRIRLIDSYRPFDQTRISSLQKLFKHYCVHSSINGKRKMTFERIVYENQHLTTERFFAFVNDFKLNEIPSEEGGSKQLTDRNKIILLFKKSSSNSRDLSFSEFIICLERLFVLLFTETQNYDRKMQKLEAEKKKRLEKQRKREEKKKEKLRKKNKEKLTLKKEEGKEGKEDGEQGEEGESEYESESEQEKIDKKLKESENKINNPQQKGPAQQKNTENDEMVKQMMKNFQIVNPTDQVKDAVKAVKKEKENEEDDDDQLEIQFDPYAISDQEKIESYMLRLGVDNFKLMQKKMRYFEKANYKHDEGDPLDKALELKKSKMQTLKKDQLTHYENASMHEEWNLEKKASEEKRTKRLLNIRQMISERDQEKYKAHMADSLPKDAYEKKKKILDEHYLKRQKGQMASFALARVTKMKEEEDERSINFSLEMISRSTPNQLPFHKINPERYLNYDPTDRIFMQEFGEYDVTFRGKMARDASLVESTKKRARELQNQETKRLNQITENRFKNPHYLQKFLQRKW